VQSRSGHARGAGRSGAGGRDLAKDGASSSSGHRPHRGSAAAVRAQQIASLISLSATEGITQIGNYVFAHADEERGARAIAQIRAEEAQRALLRDHRARFVVRRRVNPRLRTRSTRGGSEVRAYEHTRRHHDLKPFVSRMVGRSQQDLDERKSFMEESQKIIEFHPDTVQAPQGDSRA